MAWAALHMGVPEVFQNTGYNITFQGKSWFPLKSSSVYCKSGILKPQKGPKNKKGNESLKKKKKRQWYKERPR